jgi:hypothetical protein
VAGQKKLDYVIVMSMSKKTKRQKIAADLRRIQKPVFTTSPDPTNQKSNIERPETPKEEKNEQYQRESLYVYPVQLIRKDLTKTLILSILAISLELALFFLLEKHISLPFIN